MSGGIVRSMTTKYVVSLALILINLATLACSELPTNQWKLVKLYAQRFRVTVPYREPFWKDDTYVGVHVGSEQFRGLVDLVILDNRKQEVAATFPLAIDRKKNYKGDDPRVNVLSVRLLAWKWLGEDRLIYLNSDGEVVLGNVKNSEATRLHRISPLQVRQAYFSERRPVLYYFQVNGDGVKEERSISLVALDYWQNKTRVIWCSKRSQIPYTLPAELLNVVHYLGEWSEKDALVFIVRALVNEETRYLLHIIPREKPEQGSVALMNLPTETVVIDGVQPDWDKGAVWVQALLTDDVSDLRSTWFFKLDLRQLKVIEGFGFPMSPDECISFWQYLPRRKLHAIVRTSYITKEDRTHLEYNRLCLYDASFSRLLAAFDLEEEVGSSGGSFSPSEEYLLLRRDLWHVEVYRLVTSRGDKE